MRREINKTWLKSLEYVLPQFWPANSYLFNQCNLSVWEGIFAKWLEEQSLAVHLLTEILSENSISVYLLLSEAWYESITCSVNIHVDLTPFPHERIRSGMHESLCKPQKTSTLYGFLLAKVHISPSVSVHRGYSLITGCDVNCGVPWAQEFLPQREGLGKKKKKNHGHILQSERDKSWVPRADSEKLNLRKESQKISVYVLTHIFLWGESKHIFSPMKKLHYICSNAGVTLFKFVRSASKITNCIAVISRWLHKLSDIFI